MVRLLGLEGCTALMGNVVTTGIRLERVFDAASM